MKISEKIKKLRKEYSLTQQEFAKLLDLPRYTISNWEQGRSEPALSDLINIADSLKLSTDFILGRSDDFGIVTFAGENLSQEEKEVLRAYRALNFDQQKTIRIQLKALVSETKDIFI